MKEQSDDEEIKIEEIQKKIKENIFQIFQIYVSIGTNISSRLYYILTFIEMLQILWFSIHPHLTFFANPIFLQQFRQFLSYLNFENHIREDPSLMQFMMILTFSIILIYLICQITSVVLVVKKIKWEIKKTIHKIVTFQIIILNTILVIPVFNISFIVLYCDNQSDYYPSDMQCYNLEHVVLCILAVISILTILISALFNWLLFYDKDPTSRSFIGVSSNLFKLGKLFLKIIPPIYFVIDLKKNYQNVYIFVELALIIAYIFFFRFLSVHNYNQKHFYFQYFFQSFHAFFCIHSIINYYLEKEMKGGLVFLESIIAGLFFAIMTGMIEKYSTDNFLLENMAKMKIKKQNVQKFLFILLDLHYENSKNNKRTLLITFKTLKLEDLEKEEMIDEINERQETNKIVFNFFFKNLISHLLQDNNILTLKIIDCHVYFSLKKKIYAIHKIAELFNDKLSFGDEFMVYKFYKRHNLIKQFLELQISEKNSAVEDYFHFSQKMNQLMEEIQSCGKNNLEYWKELSEDSPSFAKVKSLSLRYSKYEQNIKSLVQEIQQIFPNNKTILLLYHEFLVNIGISIKQCARIKEKLNLDMGNKYNEADTNDEKKIKFKQSQNLSVICISTFLNEFGTVLSCNNEIFQLLGYQKSQLVGSKVLKIIPNIYHELHDGFILSFLKNLSTISHPSQKVVFAIKKNGKIVEIFLAVKIIPNIITGFQLVGFMKKQNKEDESFVMINRNTLGIEGVSDEFCDSLQGKLSEVKLKYETMSITQLFPQISQETDFEEGNQIEVTFKVMDLTQHLLRDQQTSKKQKSEENILLKVYKIYSYSQLQIVVFQMGKKIKDQLISLSKIEIAISKSRKTINPRQTKISNFTIAELKRKKRKEIQESFIDQLPIQHKLEQYISESSHKNELFILGILLFFFFLMIFTSSVIKYILDRQNKTKINTLYEHIELSSNISLFEGEIMIFNEKIYNPLRQLSETNHTKYIDKIDQSVSKLQSSFIELIKNAIESEGASLEVNENNYYLFLSKEVTNSTTYEKQLYLDGFFQFISLERSLTSYNYTAFEERPIQIQEIYKYVNANGLQLLPSLACKTTQKYSAYFDDELKEQMDFQFYFALIKILVILIIFLIIFFLIRHFDKYNKETIKIYRKMSLFDIQNMEKKCANFLKHYIFVSAEFHEKTKRDSYLAKEFPKKSMVNIAEEKQSYKKSASKSSISKSSKPSFEKITKWKEDFYDNQEEIDDTVSLLEKEDRNGTEKKMNTLKSLKKISNKQLNNVKLKNYKKMTNKYLFSFGILFLLFLTIFAAYIISYSFQDDFQTEKKNLKNLTALDKNVLYSLYYGYKAIQNPQQQLYETLFYAQFKQFYSITSEVYPLIGDPIKILREFYTTMQGLNQMVAKRNITLTGGKIKFMDEIQNNLLQNVYKTVSYIEKDLKNKRQILLNEIGTIGTIKFVIQIIISLIFCWVLRLYLFQTLKKSIKYSTCMIKMIPMSLILKNNKLKNTLLTESENEL